MSINPPSIITRIEVQQRNKQRFNIYINDEYAFSVHEDVLVSSRLLKGKEIDAEEMKAILAEEEKKKAEHVGYRLLSYRSRTKKEMKHALAEKGFEHAMIEELIRLWEEQGYINDEQFAHQWVHERLANKKKGPRVLQEELKRKGISEQIIERALNQLGKEENEQSCLALAEKKWRTYSRQEDILKRKQKLILYLQRRGYTYDIIQSILPRIIES